jgi:phosphatidylinositol alpha-1,6-mannosyltransferase
MKMLFLTERFPPSEGGSRIYYYYLCANYPGIGPIVLTKKVDGYNEFDKKIHFKILRKGKPLENWKFYQLPRLFPTLAWAIYLIFKEKINVIHCGEFFPGGVIGLIVKKLLGKPYVYYVHGEAIRWFKQYPYQHKIFRLILKNAARVVAACSYAEEGLRRDYSLNSKKVIKITPGVEYQKFNPEWIDIDLIRNLGVKKKNIILTIARLIEMKGQDTIIRAMPKIVKEVPDAIYVVGGRGPYEEKLRHLVAELNLEKHVMFLGFVPIERVSNLYSICDVFVMINRETPGEGPEGFGMVFTEASAAGKPVIGGRSGGTEDSILDGITGYRVDPLNVDEVASCIIKILKDGQLRKTLGRNGREWVVKNFDWRERSKQLEKLNISIFENKST